MTTTHTLTTTITTSGSTVQAYRATDLVFDSIQADAIARNMLIIVIGVFAWVHVISSL